MTSPVSSARPVHGVFVAHPDDETLWCGGEILSGTGSDWIIVALCRGDDPDRAPRFRDMLRQVSARGTMGRMDDGPDQRPLQIADVAETLEDLLPRRAFDAVYTHGPLGEYTRHRRHEEVCRAVVALWGRRRLTAGRLYMFAYEDGGGAFLPRADGRAPVQRILDDALFSRKVELVTNTYGFAPGSWEARAVPRVEAFRMFASADAAADWIRREESRAREALE